MDTVNLTIQQGDTFALDVQWIDDTTGQPVDLTGATARMQLRSYYASPAVVLDLAVGTGITIDAAEGRFTIVASATQTAGLSAQSGVYDLEVTFASNVVKKVIRGTFTVDPEVTR